ncbi:HAD-IIA family hydrolase [Halobellus ruber]|uniref:HAD-IIA family hydrolase n=1 Tax=Halobellus ruber TaxID=2761102 RepID=A0A7J9SGY0_9EURY|nr:HAD-IIA family hydrolase [Halobellus ruber]MBB6645653.1 HAD-IIA family hydrolase [Halobellus ruber]
MSAVGYEAAVLDLDGTVYLGDGLIPGVGDGIRRLRESVGPVRFLTNKAIARRGDYSEKLRRLGIDAERRHVINSGWVTAQYVSDRYPRSAAFVVGEAPLIEEFHDAGVDTTTDDSGDLVVASMDRGFDYDDLDVALRTLDDGEAPFLATNPDRTCPTESGAVPDAAGMIGAIEAVTGRTVDEVLGKPSPRMVEITVGEIGVAPEDCLMIGDRIETDILMGERAGMTTVLVLSGVTDREMIPGAEADPDYVIDSLGGIGDVLDDR